EAGGGRTSAAGARESLARGGAQGRAGPRQRPEASAAFPPARAGDGRRASPRAARHDFAAGALEAGADCGLAPERERSEPGGEEGFGDQGPVAAARGRPQSSADPEGALRRSAANSVSPGGGRMKALKAVEAPLRVKASI